MAMESSVDIPAEQPAADTKEAPPTTSEGAGTGGSEISPPEAPPPTEDAVDMTKDRPLQRSKPLLLDGFSYSIWTSILQYLLFIIQSWLNI